ncbi:MAG: alpha/beta hydrolase-fold protein [Bacteroidales bacterium]|nr:alpha/beta hydrolase-fold protein [Bacteroidales bacterium]
MKIIRTLLIALCLMELLFLFHSCKKDDIKAEQVKEFSLHSVHTGSDYAIWVVLPKEYNPDLAYETAYLLDAQNYHLRYDRIAKITEEQSLTYNKQNVIVVGISSENERERDFTPSNTPLGGGGSEKYSKFLEFELIPRIESDYSVDTTPQSRLIIGHSYGGLFTSYLFIKQSHLFHNYLMLSPSLWYDNALLLQQETDFRALNTSIDNLVFVGCGELEESIVLVAQEWDYRLASFYPNCTHSFYKVISRAHLESAFPDVEKGLDFYFKNK